jgi:hypothetical protein
MGSETGHGSSHGGGHGKVVNGGGNGASHGASNGASHAASHGAGHGHGHGAPIYYGHDSVLFNWKNFKLTTRHLAVGVGTVCWYWIFYRLKKDGGHLLGHHSWEH